MRMIQGRVLFISENNDISTLIVRILNRSGCTTTAVRPREALQALTEKGFNCVILDWVTEEDRNLDFCQLIRSISPQIAVFLFTGIASGVEVTLTFRNLSEEGVALLNFDSLVADIFPDAKPLLDAPHT